MQQYQAGYILDAVLQALNVFKPFKDSQSDDRLLAVQGLYQQLSTFDVRGPHNLTTNAQYVHPVLAVVRNLITRGTPTLASEYVEQAFAKALGETSAKEKDGSIRFPFVSEKNSTTPPDKLTKLFRALHPIDPRAKDRTDYLNLSDLDSSFERDFLLSIIPESASYLAQLLEHQRSRDSIAGNRNAGRVDFSLEIPYFKSRSQANRFKQDVQLRCRSKYVVETDGKRYHEQLIDDLKDEALSDLPNRVSHVREGSTYGDTRQLISRLRQDAFIQQIEANFNDPDWLKSPETLLVLSPLLIARIQLGLLDYLISRQEEWFEPTELRIAVIERDVPAAQIAIDDLLEQLRHLNALADNPLFIPTVTLTVFPAFFPSYDFYDHPLQPKYGKCPLFDFNTKDYDLIFDVSILRRTGIFADDSEYDSDRTWTIRSSHYTKTDTTNRITCSPAITYKPITNTLSNEAHEPIEETVEHLRYFLRNIFRKTDFRDGQLPIINRALQMKSVIGLLPTGGGKSLTYQLPALLQPGVTVVVDPIRSLMIDQFRGLRELGIDRCAFINSTLSATEKRYNQNQLLTGGQLGFVFVSPERFVIQEFRDALELAAANGYYFAYAVIDEVHCVSEWGHDFRTPYLNLGENTIQFCRTTSGRPVPLVGLTATASFDVLADIERELKIPDDDGNAVVRYENTVRDEINYGIIPVDVTAKEGLLSSWDVNEFVGIAKQQAARNLLEEKERCLRPFNQPGVVDKLVRESWESYVPASYREAQTKRWETETAALRSHLEQQRGKLLIPGTVFADPTGAGKSRRFDYGAVVFTPHRTGYMGIQGMNGFLTYQTTGYEGDASASARTDNDIGGDEYGYFMGSGDDENAATIDKESFANLDRFTNNEFSVMVATKAFGMGIDKPNVRMTIHLNLPSSIESFVQEAGRAGRDKKLSYSAVLYNDDVFSITDAYGSREYHYDREILLYFHKNAFKGAMKERATIWELRNQVTYPSLTNSGRMANLIHELYPATDVAYRVRQGTNNWANNIFVDAGDEVGIGKISLPDGALTAYTSFADRETCLEILNLVKTKIEQEVGGLTTDVVSNWLRQRTMLTQQHIGLERMLSDMVPNKEGTLRVPFTNRYYSAPAKNRNDFRLNPDFIQLLKTTTEYNTLQNAERASSPTLSGVLTSAIMEGISFGEFIDRLGLKDEQLATELKRTDTPNQLHQYYYRGRSADDTAKAIYRLVSVGVIDSYTIDYQNKLYTLSFTKKQDDDYFRGLQDLMARYTSAGAAERTVAHYKAEFRQLAAENKVTTLSFILGKLTDFVYEKIKEKRLRGIDDMIGLCRHSIQFANEPLKQNGTIKDEIFYYFNAKYSRAGFVEQSTGEQASLVDDRNENLDTRATILKYLNLVNDARTGQFINNAKHLRGSTMRMLRSYGDDPAYLILKAYTLFVLSQNASTLTEEAIREMANGLVLWKQKLPALNEVEWITYLRQMIAQHITEKRVVRWFDDIEDLYYAQYYTNWFGQFTTDKLNNA